MEQFTPTVELTKAALAAVEMPAGTPFLMLNLLRYRESADYGENAEFAPCSGRDAYYARYVPAFNEVASSQNIAGIKMVLLAGVVSNLVAPAGEQWDDMVVIEYPSYAAFRSVVESAQYKSHAAPHRLAALADWRLLATQPQQAPADADAPQTPDAAEIWATYQKAWENVGDDERRALLERSLASDCVYTDPAGETHNYAELIAYIGRFRGATPGATFTNHEFATHHGHSLAKWTLYDASGATLSEGISYAHFGADGRLTRIAGFFKAPEAVLDEAELAVWRTYQSAWSAMAADKRLGLLAQSAAPDAIYSDPTDECAGRTALIEHIEASQAKTPGATFQNDEFVTHHGQGLSAWTMRDGAGATVATGHSYARFGADGLLMQMTGFFQQA